VVILSTQGIFGLTIFNVMKRLFTKIHLPIILAPIILFAPIIFAGKALVWGTVSTQFIPWWDFAWDTLIQGHIPLWNPWVGMGAPMVGNYQSAIFYPPYWILLLLYAIAGIRLMSWGVTVVVVFHLIWSGLGVAKLLEELELSKLSQIVGGLAFSLSGYLVARSSFLSINAAVAWLPWILLYSLRLANKKEYAFWALSAVITLQLLAGHAQTAWYSILLGGIWTFFLAVKNYIEQNKLRNVWQSIYKYILAGLLSAGISAIQLVPTLEYLIQSQRSGDYGFAEAMTYSFWPWRFLTLIVPNLFGSPAAGNYWGYGNYWEDAVYVGLLPLLIAIGVVLRAFFVKRKELAQKPKASKRELIIFLSGIIFVSFLLALGDNTKLFPFLYRHVPTFGFFQAPTRYSVWAEISLAILAGIGIDQLAQVTGKRKYWIRLAAAGCIAVIGGSLIGWKFLTDVKTTFFIPIGLAGIFGLGTALLILFQPDKDHDLNYKVWGGLIVILIAADLIVAGWGLNPGVGIGFYDVAKSVGNGTRTYITSDLEYNLKFSKYFRFESFSPEVSWEEMHQDLLPNLPIIQRIELVNNFDPLVPSRFQTWLSEYEELDDLYQHPMTGLMNIGQIISEVEGKINRVDIRLDGSFSEVRINDLVEIVESDQEALNIIIDEKLDLSRSLILSSMAGIVENKCQNGSVGVVSVDEKAPGYIKIKYDLDKDGWLIWSQSWYPGWVAVIDGKQEVEVNRANYLFQAVCVPGGEHILEIVYRPVSFYIGAGITFSSLFFTIAVGLIVRKKNRIS